VTRGQASQAEVLQLLAAAQRDAAAGRELEQQLAHATARVRELQAAIAAGHSAGEASEMEFLRKERRAEVEQVDQEWRRRWQGLQEQCVQLQAQVEAAAEAASSAAQQHVKEVDTVR
jgi:hypothetical protein